MTSKPALAVGSALGLFTVRMFHMLAPKLRDALLFGPHAHVSPSFTPPHRVNDLLINDKIHVRHYFCQDSKHPQKQVLIFCHGRGGNVSKYEREIWTLLQRLPFYDIISFDYEGYGNTKGEPSESVVLNDGVEVLRWLAQLNIYESFAVYGYSLGGSVATNMVYVWQKERIKGLHCRALILHGTFASLSDTMWFLPSFLIKFYSTNLPIKQWLSQIDKVPLLIAHSKDDELFPLSHAQTNYESSQAPIKSFHTLKYGHRYIRKQFLECALASDMSTFLKKCASNEQEDYDATLARSAAMQVDSCKIQS